MNIRNIVIVGGGSLGHVITGWLSAQGYNVSVLSRRPAKWSKCLVINTPNGKLTGEIKHITDRPSDIIPDADIILLTVPGYANLSELQAIAPYLKERSYLGAVFSSSGFFFEALKIIPDNIRLWGFQRVPFISRVKEYGHEANLLSSKAELNIAVERASEKEKEEFRQWTETAFKTPTVLRNNYLEVSISNSNPILHTARLFTMFKDWTDDTRSDHNILFYEEWTEEAAELMIQMDAELFDILKHLPVDIKCLVPLLEYYESHDAASLKEKLSSIEGFKGITSPMKEDDRGWYPDFGSRYFTEDFGYSLKYIWELGKKYNVSTPKIDQVYTWGKAKIQ
ncbi:MAG: NAD/NADP octopine/nopaline dehydrogenase family protein [Muribaculaceae bacterium]|nr:NAD/NADP octopine/nopaline dehydrogenase family protein [Muribaculaceae bacterium]